ncbi:MAG: sigma-70 family RNA polymerase sigma factor [Planctomycetes bacterium]|nr:sigma-70 family RNA polymerase sigma factor [Planctomycetota bacterium]
MAEPNDRPSTEPLASLLARFEGPLLRYALGLTGDLEAARDAVQDTFVRALQQDLASRDGQIGPWLFAVCRNRALDIRRKERFVTRTIAIPLDAGPAHSEQPGAAVEAADDSQRLLAALERLPAIQQEVVRLKFQAGLRYKEIAEVTGLSVTNVGFLLHTALRKLRDLCGGASE